jgi:PKD repeat protein
VKISSNKIAGANPLTLNLSSEGTMDLDQDPLKFDWEIKFGSEVIQNSKEANPQIILKLPGTYIISLKVSDSHGAESKSDDLEIVVGNDPPVVKIDFINSNSSFFFIGDTLEYIIKVVDTEDGNIDNVEIDLSKIYFNIEPVDVEIEGFNNIIKQPKLTIQDYDKLFRLSDKNQELRYRLLLKKIENKLPITQNEQKFVDGSFILEYRNWSQIEKILREFLPLLGKFF